MSESSKNKLLPWVAVSQLLKVNLSKLHAWLARQGDFEGLFKTSAAELGACGFTESDIEKIQTIYWPTVEAEVQWMTAHATVVTFHDPAYPVLLKEIADPPLVLYVQGDKTLLSLPQLGIVGTRHPSKLGLSLAYQFAGALAQRGFLITSGLAAGIDGASHQGTLAVAGQTVAVLGTGLNHIYPSQHKDLARQIVKGGGALVSEFPFNTPPSPWNFPRRNRIISGLSLGVLVVEAALRSGSLITARLALEQNREVFAIPGSIQEPQARGCHQLIRQGAKLVESVADIIEEFKSGVAFLREQMSRDPAEKPSMESRAELKRALAGIDYAVTAFDSILEHSGLTATELSSMLLELELGGQIKAVSGGYLRCY